MERDAFGIRRLLQSCAPAPQIDDALAASLSRRRHQCYIRRLRITDRVWKVWVVVFYRCVVSAATGVGGLIFGQRARRLFVII